MTSGIRSSHGGKLPCAIDRVRHVQLHLPKQGGDGAQRQQSVYNVSLRLFSAQHARRGSKVYPGSGRACSTRGASCRGSIRRRSTGRAQHLRELHGAELDVDEVMRLKAMGATK